MTLGVSYVGFLRASPGDSVVTAPGRPSGGGSVGSVDGPAIAIRRGSVIQRPRPRAAL